MQNKYIKFFIIALAVAVIVPQVAFASWWNPASWGIWNRIFHFQQAVQKQNPVICPMIAKLCPDGSSVSPQGPKCEFAACPEKKDQTVGWKTYTNDKYGFQFNYPQDWKITDNSKDANTSDKGLIKTIGVQIESPSKYDLVGYVGVPVNYRILFYNPDYPEQKITSIADFGSPDPKFGHQSWWNVEASKQVKEATVEYKIGQQIISTFKFTNAVAQTSEQACVASGGKVATVSCYCSGAVNFYNTCLVGACSCPPDPQFKKEVKNCQCPSGKCWDGKTCTDYASALNIQPTDETANWKTYDSGRGFYFKYPNDFTFDNGNSDAVQIIFSYNDSGKRFFIINIDKSDLALEQYTKNTVTDLKSGNAQSAAPVSVSYKPYSFGTVDGNMILSQAADVLKNTDAMFLIKNSDSVFSFRYSYSAITESQNSALKEIKEIISTFKFTK